jgi:hypothetical protein
MAKPDTMTLADRVMARLKELRLSRREASQRMIDHAEKAGVPGVSLEFVRDITNGKKTSIRGENLVLLALALEKDPHWLLGVDPDAANHPGSPPNIMTLLEIPVVGRAEAGRWAPREKRASGELSPATDFILAVPLPGYPHHLLYALQVFGVGHVFPDGTHVVVEPAAKDDVAEDDFVVVERERHDMVETTIRQVKRLSGRWVLAPPGIDAPDDNDLWAITDLPDAPRIVGLVAWMQKVFKRRVRIGG